MERNSNHSRGDGLLLRSSTELNSNGGATRSPITSSPDFVLQWGNRKRLRCMKVQFTDRDNNKDNTCKKKDSAGLVPAQRTTTRVDRRVVRSEFNKDSNQSGYNNDANSNGGSGYINLRQRPSSPARRILRNSEGSLAMRGHSNGVRGLTSPDRGGAGGCQDGKGNGNHDQQGNNYNSKSSNNHNENNNGSGSSDSKRGGSSSGSDVIPAVWPPKFVIALTNKEKEEDFLAIKGSKLPQRPKKRAKFIQRNLNLVSPGGWLCELTLDRYEVKEKKVTKKRPRGLKAMGNMDSDSD